MVVALSFSDEHITKDFQKVKLWNIQILEQNNLNQISRIHKHENAKVMFTTSLF